MIDRHIAYIDNKLEEYTRALVAIPDVPSTSQAPDHNYNYEKFNYDQSPPKKT
jgi:hypothetical protein